MNILEPFVLKDFYPASASIGIPADAWPTWTFSRAIPESELVASKFSVYKVSSNSRVNGTLSLSPTGKQVRFKPDSVFDILTLYEMRLSAEVKDTYGNKLGTSLKTRFTTQPPPLPPTNLASFANYSDESYNATLSAILSNSNLYLQMVAEDPSFSTYEAASVRLDSDDGTYDGVVLTLVETNPPSGIFRIVYPVNLPAGTIATDGDELECYIEVGKALAGDSFCEFYAYAPGDSVIYDFISALENCGFTNVEKFGDGDCYTVIGATADGINVMVERAGDYFRISYFIEGVENETTVNAFAHVG